MLAARAALARGGDDVLVHYADIPLLTAATLRSLRERLDAQTVVSALGFEADDPRGYGRFIEKDGALIAIREHKDASAEERAIRRCNAGPIALAGSQALDLLDRVGDDNAAREFYLPDVVEIAGAQGLRRRRRRGRRGRGDGRQRPRAARLGGGRDAAARCGRGRCSPARR